MIWALAFLGLTACADVNDLDRPPIPLGDFKLGHNVVVAPNLVQGPLSREASDAELIAAMKNAVDARFSRYEGARLYHLGITLEGYVLAKAGVPVVAAPKSVLLLKVTAWDDAEERRLNPEPETITVVESISGKSVLGSGVTQTKEEQIAVLTKKAAKLIERWLAAQNRKEGWFKGRKDAPE